MWVGIKQPPGRFDKPFSLCLDSVYRSVPSGVRPTGCYHPAGKKETLIFPCIKKPENPICLKAHSTNIYLIKGRDDLDVLCKWTLRADSGLLVSHVEYQGHERLSVCPQPVLPSNTDSSSSRDVHLLVNCQSLITAAPAFAGALMSAFHEGHPWTDNKW